MIGKDDSGQEIIATSIIALNLYLEQCVLPG